MPERAVMMFHRCMQRLPTRLQSEQWTLYSSTTNTPLIIARQKPNSNSFWLVETPTQAAERNMDTLITEMTFTAGNNAGVTAFGVNTTSGSPYGTWDTAHILDGQVMFECSSSLITRLIWLSQGLMLKPSRLTPTSLIM